MEIKFHNYFSIISPGKEFQWKAFHFFIFLNMKIEISPNLVIKLLILINLFLSLYYYFIDLKKYSSFFFDI